MARPRTASNILALRGANKKHPERAREREGEPTPKAGIGPAPAFFTPKEREAWDYLVDIAPIGVLGDSDRAYLEVAAELLAHKRNVGVAAIDAPKLNRLEMMLGKLGLNPADRSRVKVGGKPNAPQAGNRFGGLDG